MPGTGAIRWGDISFRTRPRPPTEPPILTRRTRHQRPSPTGVEGAGGTGGPGRGAGGRRGQGTHMPARRPPQGLRDNRSVAAVPVGGGRAWPGFETTTPSEARVWRSRGRAAAHERTEQTHPRTAGHAAAGDQAGRRPQAHTAARPIKAGHTPPGTPVGPQATPPKRKAYSPRNALIAGISRTACTRPAR